MPQNQRAKRSRENKKWFEEQTEVPNGTRRYAGSAQPRERSQWMKKMKNKKTNQNRVNKAVRRHQEYFLDNKGHIEDYGDEGFFKIKENPVMDGACIHDNVAKLLELWTKFPNKRDKLRLRAYRFHQTKLGRHTTHINIYDEDTDKIIDVSNGVIKMINYAVYCQINALNNIHIMLEHDFTHDDYIKIIPHSMWRDGVYVTPQNKTVLNKIGNMLLVDLFEGFLDRRSNSEISKLFTFTF